MGPDEVQHIVLRKLNGVVAKLLSSILEKLWQSCEVTSDWKKGNITPIFKVVKRRMLAIYQPVLDSPLQDKTC